MKKNYKEDFTAVIRMRYPDGETVGIPDFDFDMHFTSGFTEYTAGRRNGQLYRCAVSEADPTVLLVRFDNHGLHPCPSLGLRVVYHIPDSDFPDGFRDVVRTQSTDICLTVGASDIPTAAEISVILPYIKGEKGDPGKDGVDAAPYDDTEIRREIVGLWDTTAEMQAKLADLYSTETRNLLKRLGYNDDDIEEYIWAVAHLNLDITMDQLHKSVVEWELREIRWANSYERMTCYVLPKWESGLLGYTRMRDFSVRFNQTAVLYIPHVTINDSSDYTWVGFYVNCQYWGGVHATEPIALTFRTSSMVGIGSITGKITEFLARNFGDNAFYFKMRYIRELKSEVPISLDCAFYNLYYLTDLRGVDTSNATNVILFAGLPREFFPLTTKANFVFNDSVIGRDPIRARSFTDSTFLFGYMGYMSGGVFSDRQTSSIQKVPSFTNCEIVIDSDNAESFTGLPQLGCMRVGYNARSIIRLPKSKWVNFMYLRATTGPEIIGVWEVYCPKLSSIDYLSTGDYKTTGVMLFDIGENIPPGCVIPLDTFLADYRLNEESFHRSFASWKPVPESSRPCIVNMSANAAKLLSEEEIADLSEKGYTISVV
ncbi:MAG: hypothetical protein K2I48_00030 [Muribaculaceae bacterium]|nr:hypothetical protein [Muribaculaceae bacterium]